MKAGAIQVRAAREEDLGLVLEFIRALAVYEKLERDCTARPEDLRETLFGAQPRAKVLLAFAGDEPAGFAVYLFAFSTFAARPVLYLEDLFVKPELRGRGIGKELFRALERIAIEERCLRIDWAVLDWNGEAIRFYEGIGAKAHREWVRYSLLPAGSRAG